MSNQPENEMQQPETITPEEVRQSLMTELDATKQAIEELGDEELEEVTGGMFGIKRKIAGYVIRKIAQKLF